MSAEQATRMTRETILLTGATGAVGHEVVRTLLHESDPARLFLLMRGESRQVSSKLARLLSWAEVPRGTAYSVVVLHGNPSKPRLGMSPRDFARVTGEVTRVLHMAATTGLDQTAEQARFNVASTRELLEVTRRCRFLEGFGLVSTAYVAGRRSGVIRENELEFETGFSNEYERSKALAERAARTAMGDLPIAVYRPSLVVGRRTDGRLAHSGLFSSACRLFRRGLLSALPGDASQPVDLVPVDFAARSLVALFLRAFVPGSTYHLCAGPQRSFTLEGLFEAMAVSIRRTEPEWRRGDPRRGAALESARLRSILRGPLETAKSFDTTAFDRAIGRCGIELAHAREWIQPLVDRALVSVRGEKEEVGA